MPAGRTHVTPPRLGGPVVARIAGIPVSLHGSWLILVAAIAILGGRDVASDIVHNPTAVASLIAGVVFAVVISMCILAHELAHSLVARAYGLRVRGITLFALGGVSQIEHEAPRPRSEFFVALAGPLASVVIAATLAVVARMLNPGINGYRGPWGTVAVVNGYLALFNLLPAFPMDGGRILRSALWAAMGRVKGTRLAAMAGRGFALLMIGFGGVTMLRAIARGAPGDGFWLVLVGLFLLNAAGAAQETEGGEHPNDPERDRSPLEP